MTCVGCGAAPTDIDDPGVMITPIGIFRGRKSGQVFVEKDLFPDGTYEKFLCWDCLVSPSCRASLAELLGLYEQGHDEPNVCVVQTPDPPWPSSQEHPDFQEGDWGEVWPGVGYSRG